MTNQPKTAEEIYQLAISKYCSPQGKANPETHAYIDGYNEGGHSSEVRWVKASERLPVKRSPHVIVRNVRTGKVMTMRNFGHNRGWDVAMDQMDYIETEWLDESSPVTSAGSGLREPVTNDHEGEKGAGC